MKQYKKHKQTDIYTRKRNRTNKPGYLHEKKSQFSITIPRQTSRRSIIDTTGHAVTFSIYTGQLTGRTLSANLCKGFFFCMCAFVDSVDQDQPAQNGGRKSCFSDIKWD